MKTSRIVLSILAASLIFSCHKEKPHKRNGCGDCPKEQVCTTEFRTLSLSIKNSSGEPIALDSFKTFQVRTGQVVNLRISNWEDSVSRLEGRYPYWSDAFTGSTHRHGEEVHFFGFKNGQEVVKQILIVGYDCCHVVAESENTELVLNLDN